MRERSLRSAASTTYAAWPCLALHCTGSIADCDLDVLFEFEPGHALGLAFFAVEIELVKLLGLKVGLNIPGVLSRYSRDRVLAEAEAYYAQAELAPNPPPHA